MKVKLSHIALACPDLEAIVQKLSLLSLSVSSTHEVPTEGVKVSMVTTPVSDELRIELLEPLGPSSPVAKYLSKHPRGGLHHISFETQELEKWIPILEKEGLEVLSPGIRVSARGKALFLHPKSFGGVLVELEEMTSQE